MAKKIGLALALVVIFALLYRYAGSYLTLEGIKSAQSSVSEYYSAHPILLPLAFFGIYVISVALSVPGAAIMTLAAGAIFGLWVGLVIVSFASSIGALLAFLVVRYLIGDSLQSKYGDKLVRINEGVKQEGAFYLFAMRLVPAFPFFLINILFALTTLQALKFYWVSQLGMLAGTAVYVNAGTELAKLDSLRGLLSVPLIASFVALGIFPIVAKKALAFIRARMGNTQAQPRANEPVAEPQASEPQADVEKQNG